MSKKKIAIGGVTRNLPAGYSADGTMRELVGWNHIDGILRPAAKAEIDSNAPVLSETEELLYIHKFQDNAIYIVYDNTAKKIYSPINYCYSDGGTCERIDVLIDTDVEKPKYITSIGSILIICYGEKISKYLYKKGGEYGFEYKKAEETELPVVSFSQEFYNDRKEYNVESDSVSLPLTSDVYYSDLLGSCPYLIPNKDLVEELTHTYIGLFNQMKEKAILDNVLINSYLIRYALKNYSGEYVYLSPPIFLNCGEDYTFDTGEGTVVFEQISKKFTQIGGCKASARGYKIKFNISNTSDNYNIYQSLDIFLSTAVNPFETDRKIDTSIVIRLTNENDGRQFYYVEFGMSKQQKTQGIEAFFNFYKVLSIPVGNFDKYEDFQELKLSDIIPTLEQQPLLDFNTSMNSYSSNSGLVYNSRLHIMDIKEYLFKGYSAGNFSFLTDDTEESFSIKKSVIITYLRDSTIEYIIKSDGYSTNGMNILVSPYVSYPDSRAYKMVICVEVADGTLSKYYKRELVLTSHSFANEAYYFAGFDKKGLEIAKEYHEITDAEYDMLVNIPENNEIYRPNVMKVSGLNDPMVYPLAQTYTIGNGKIISAAVSTKTISQGQFGQYPLYVFTSDGVYAMSQGSGEVVYQTVSPLSRHVCVNVKSICDTDSAVVFATEQGLFILQGGDIIEISQAINDHGLSEYNSVDGGLQPINEAIEDVIGKQVFFPSLQELLHEGKCAYHYSRHELLLFVPDKGVVVSYSLRDGIWKSFHENLHDTVDDYPDLLWIMNNSNGKEICRVKRDGVCDYENNLLLVTNAFSLSEVYDQKNIVRMRILSNISGSIIVGLLASNDGISWTTVWKKSMECTRHINPVISLPGASYRYFILVISGNNIDEKSFIAGFEIEYESRHEDK